MSEQASKLPTADKPLIRDPDLARAIEAELEPFTGKQLAAAQTAVRKVHASGLQGPFSAILAAYQQAIRDATARARAD
jgi:hypothetical protein